MKKYYIISGLIGGVVLLCWLYGFRLTESGAMPGNSKIILSENTVFGKAVLFQDTDNQSFGIGRLKRNLGFLYRYDGGSTGYLIEEDKPFQAAGTGRDEVEDGFLVGVKTARDSNIKYIAIGNHLEGLTPTDTYHLTIDDVKKNSDNYHLAEVMNNFALFVLDEYSEQNWTIRAFDAEGKLIADHLPGFNIRYINW